MDKWVINLSKTPLTQGQLSLLQKGPNYAITPKYLPIEAYITSTEQVANKLSSQEADKLRSDINRILKQVHLQHNKHCNLNPPMQGPYRTQTGPVQGGTHSGQRGGHGHHGQTGLHKQSTNITTGYQHLQTAPQGPHLLPQKQTHYPSQRYQANRRPLHP